MSDTLNWHDLEILHAVLEQGSFSGAARSLGLSQPTVSRHIEALERSLGRELFTRGNGGLEPSELALNLAEHIGQMSEGMFAIQRTLAGKEAVPEGIVTVSIPYGLGSVPMLEALRDFHASYPAISIDLKTGPLQSNLGRREADIDLRWEQPTEPEVIFRAVGVCYTGLYATPDYLARHGIPASVAELRDHYLPYFDEPVSERVVAGLRKAGIDPTHFPFRCSGNLGLAGLMCTKGLTMNFWPVSLQPEMVQRVLPEIIVETPAMWLTMHSSLRRNARIRAVWEWLTERLPAIFEVTRKA